MPRVSNHFLRAAAMLLRTMALIVSLLLHAWTGNAMWALLEKDELQVFNSGEGMDILLEPPGLVTGEIRSAGDSVASVRSHDTVAPVAVPPLPVPSAAEAAMPQAPAEKPPEVDPVSAAGTAPQITAATPTVAAEQLPEVIDSLESKTAAHVEVIPERVPPPRTPVPTGELYDVITSQNGPVPDEGVSEASEAVPSELPPLPGMAPARPVPPQVALTPEAPRAKVSVPQPEVLAERLIAPAAEPAVPRELREPSPVETNLKHDADQMSERKPAAAAHAAAAPSASREMLPTQAPQPAPPSAVLNEPRPNEINRPQMPETQSEQEPETIEVISQPQQIVIVTDLSSGEEMKGGEATAAGIYLGRVSEKVQRAKVNPSSSMTGTAIIRFTVGIDGMLLSKEIAQSSGHPVLDDAAINTLERAAPFPPIPPDVSKTPMTFQQPFKFVVR